MNQALHAEQYGVVEERTSSATIKVHKAATSSRTWPSSWANTAWAFGASTPPAVGTRRTSVMPSPAARACFGRSPRHTRPCDDGQTVARDAAAQVPVDQLQRLGDLPSSVNKGRVRCIRSMPSTTASTFNSANSATPDVTACRFPARAARSIPRSPSSTAPVTGCGAPLKRFSQPVTRTPSSAWAGVASALPPVSAIAFSSSPVFAGPGFADVPAPHRRTQPSVRPRLRLRRASPAIPGPGCATDADSRQAPRPVSARRFRKVASPTRRPTSSAGQCLVRAPRPPALLHGTAQHKAPRSPLPPVLPSALRGVLAVRHVGAEARGAGPRTLLRRVQRRRGVASKNCRSSVRVAASASACSVPAAPVHSVDVLGAPHVTQNRLHPGGVNRRRSGPRWPLPAGAARRA